VRLSSEDVAILDGRAVNLSMSRSGVIRQALRTLKVLGAGSISEVFKPEILKLIVESEEARDTLTVIDALKYIPQIEAELKLKGKWID